MDGNAPINASVDTSTPINQPTEWNPVPTNPSEVPGLDTISKAVQQYNEINSAKNAPFIDEADTRKAKQEVARQQEEAERLESETKIQEDAQEQEAKFNEFVSELASYNPEYAEAVTSGRITPDEAMRIVELEEELSKKFDNKPEAEQQKPDNSEALERISKDYTDVLRLSQEKEYELNIKNTQLEVANRKNAELVTKLAQYETDDTKILPTSQDVYKVNESLRQLNEAKDFASLSKFLWMVNSMIVNNTKYWTQVNWLDLSETFAKYIDGIQNPSQTQQQSVKPSYYNDQNFF